MTPNQRRSQLCAMKSVDITLKAMIVDLQQVIRGCENMLFREPAMVAALKDHERLNLEDIVLCAKAKIKYMRSARRNRIAAASRRAKKALKQEFGW
jgi:hypothetical protein